jgi:mRNA interferase RelE/StbE
VYRVELRRLAKRALDKLPRQEQTKIVSSLLKLESDPRPRGVEKVRNTELWRIREGDYRLVYYIDDEASTISVVRIGHRRDIYRNL